MPRIKNSDEKMSYQELEYLRILLKVFSAYELSEDVLKATNPELMPNEEALAEHNLFLAINNVYVRLSKCLDIEEKGEAIPAEEIDALDKRFDAFIKAADVFLDGCANDPDYSIFAKEYFGRVKAALLPIKSYKAKFDEVKADPNKKLVLKDVIADVSWAKGLIQKDPQAKDNFNLPEEQQYKPNQHSIKENLDKYKENMLDINVMFMQHVERIGGDEIAPSLTLGYKLEMLHDALAAQYNTTKTPNTFDRASYFFNFASGMFNVSVADKVHAEKYGPDDDGIPSLNGNTCHTKNFFEYIIANQIDYTVLSGEIKKTGTAPGRMSDEAIEIFRENLKPIRLDPKYLGVDPVIYDETTKIAEMIAVTGGIADALEKNAHDKNDFNIKKVIQIGKEINEKIYNYINDLSEELPSFDDYSLLCDYLGECISQAKDVTYKVAVRNNEKVFFNNDLNMCLLALKDISENVPGLEDRYQVTFNKYTNRISQQYLSDYNTILNHNLSGDGSYAIDDAMDSIKTLYDTKQLPNEMYDKAYFMTMLRNQYYAKHEMELIMPNINYNAAKNEKTGPYKEDCKKAIIATIGRHEYDSAVKFTNNKKDKFALLHYGVNKTTYEMFLDGPKTPEQIQAVESYYEHFLNSPEVEKLLDMDPADLKRLVEDPAFADKMVFGEGDKIVKNLSSETLEVFFQESADFYKTNSDSYIRMATELKKIPALEHKIGGIKPDDYKDLFDALSNYLDTHDTSPTFSNGKLRVKEAGNLLIKTAFELSGKVGQKFQEKIDDAMQLNMLRSSKFRAAAMQTAGETMLKYTGADKQLSKAEFDKLDPASKSELSFAMKVYAYGYRCTEEIQREYKKLEIGGKMKSPELGAQILKDFSGVKDYADLADNMNFDAVINMHQDFAKNQAPKQNAKTQPEIKEAKQAVMNH